MVRELRFPHAKGQINPHIPTREACRLQQRAHMLQRRFSPAKKKKKKVFVIKSPYLFMETYKV